MIEKKEMIEKKILKYKDEIYEVINAFSHPKRSYITIDVKTKDGVPYTLCDSNDTLYDRIEKIKVEKQ